MDFHCLKFRRTVIKISSEFKANLNWITKIKIKLQQFILNDNN